MYSEYKKVRNCVVLFVIKEYGRGTSTNTHGLYVVQVAQKESRL